MFLSTFVSSIFMMQCGSGRLSWFKGVGMWKRVFLNSIISTASIAWEQPHRRVDITYYMIPRSIETVWKMLKNRRLVKDIPGMELIAVALAFGVVAAKFAEEMELSLLEKAKEKEKLKTIVTLETSPALKKETDQ